MKKIISMALVLLMLVFTFAACGAKDQQISGPEQNEALLADGVYSVDFETDSNMFHVNDALDGKGTLTVENGAMTLHITLTSQNIVNLFPGLVENVDKEGAEILQPTLDTVTYADGTTEEVNGFDIPVEVIDEEFDLALLGKKGTWYDHKVKISNPEPVAE